MKSMLLAATITGAVLSTLILVAAKKIGKPRTRELNNAEEGLMIGTASMG